MKITLAITTQDKITIPAELSKKYNWGRITIPAELSKKYNAGRRI